MQSRYKAFVWIIVVLLCLFGAMQLYRPVLTNPPVTAELQVPPEVKQVLQNSCYSCHSNETKLPWFDQVAPAYWIVASDVKEARHHLNFSEIGKLPAAQQKGLLWEAVNQIQLGAMPLPSYRRVHPGSTVTPEQLAILREYLSPMGANQYPAAPDANKAAPQYDAWIKQSSSPLQVKPEPNGVEFLPDYKNWKVLSSTDRIDNHTMREILGNDVAIKAIANHQINPWPDGTVFAKVAWAQEPDATGVVKTGAFIQVELMIRDSKKYASTKGWGWGRWRGTDLKPYGKDAAFTNECVSCHTPVAKNDYVYTMPLGGER